MRLEKSSGNGSKESKTADSLLTSTVDDGGLAVVARARSLALGAGVGRSAVVLALGAGVGGATVGAGVSAVGAGAGSLTLGARVGRATVVARAAVVAALGTGLLAVVAGARSLTLGARLLTVVAGAGSLAAVASVTTVTSIAAVSTVTAVASVVTALGTRVLTVITHASGNRLGTVLSSRALRVRASRDLRHLGVLRSTVAVLPRLVDNLAVLANIAVNRSVADVVVVPVIALLGLVDLLAVAASVGAVVRNILRATLAVTGLRDVDVLAVALLTGVGLEDVDDAAALAGLGVALTVVALVDGGHGLGLGCGSVGDGSCEGGGDGGLVSDGGSEDVGEGNIRAAERDVDSEEDGVGDGRLTTAEAAHAVKSSITTAELRVITGALDVTLVDIDTAGVVRVDLVTTVAVSVANTEVSTANTVAGAEVQIHGVGGLRKLESRETVGGTDTAKESKVTDGTGEASRRSSGGDRSSLGTGSSDSLTLRVGGSTLGVGSSSLGREDGLAVRVGDGTLRVGSSGVGREESESLSAGRLSLSVGQSRVGDDGFTTAVAVTTTSTGVCGARLTDSESSNDKRSRVVATRLDELNVGRTAAGRVVIRRLGNVVIASLKLLREDRHAIGGNVEGAVSNSALLRLDELDEDLEEDDEQVARRERGKDVIGNANGERGYAVGTGNETDGNASIGTSDERSARSEVRTSKVDWLSLTGTTTLGRKSSGGGSSLSCRDTAVGEALSSNARGQGQEQTGSETHC